MGRSHARHFKRNKRAKAQKKVWKMRKCAELVTIRAKEKLNIQCEEEANQNLLQQATQSKSNVENQSERSRVLVDIMNDWKTEPDIDIKEDVIEPVEAIDDKNSIIKENLIEPAEDNNLNLEQQPCEHVEEDENMSSFKLLTSVKEYKCHICDYKCYYLHESLNWIIKQHRDLASHCNKCNFHSLTATEFRKHVEISCDNQNVFKCNFCSQEFELKSEFLKHCQKSKDENDYHCRKCNFYYLRKCALINHLDEVHGGLFKCTTCKYQSVFEDEFKVHLKSHTNNADQPLDSESAVLSNKRVCANNKNGGFFYCTTCKYQSVFEDDFKVHLKSHTNNADQPLDSESAVLSNKRVCANNKNGGFFYCTTCKYQSVFEDDFKVHLKSHTNNADQPLDSESSVLSNKRVRANNKNLICEKCGKSFTRICQFKRHFLTHTGEKPYKCQFCVKAYTSYSALKKHLLNHKNSKPHCCNVCDYKCTARDRLRCHMRLHTGEKPFKCLICDNKFSYKVSLQNHMQVHTGKQFCCELCDYDCSDKSTLKRHIIKFHNKN